jgi:PhnB protein
VRQPGDSARNDFLPASTSTDVDSRPARSTTGAAIANDRRFIATKGSVMTQAIAYLGFDGNCAEAMRFYEKVLRGKLELMMSGADSPMAAHIPKESAHRILHARLTWPGGGMLFAGDSPDNVPYEGIKGVAIAVDYPTVAEADAVFAALSEGGKVTMPMSPAFWAKRFGMCIDRFGASWIVNGEPIAVA